MVFQVDGVRYSVVWIAGGAALFVACAAGLLGVPPWPHLLFVFLGVFGLVTFERGMWLAMLYHAERTARPEPPPYTPAADDAPEPEETDAADLSDLYLLRARIRALVYQARQVNGIQATRIPRWSDLDGISSARWQELTNALAEDEFIVKYPNDRTELTWAGTLGKLYVYVAHPGYLPGRPAPDNWPHQRPDAHAHSPARDAE